MLGQQLAGLEARRRHTAMARSHNARRSMVVELPKNFVKYKDQESGGNGSDDGAGKGAAAGDSSRVRAGSESQRSVGQASTLSGDTDGNSTFIPDASAFAVAKIGKPPDPPQWCCDVGRRGWLNLCQVHNPTSVRWRAAVAARVVSLLALIWPHAVLQAFRIRWDIASMLVLLYCLVEIPFRVAFESDVEGGSHHTTLHYPCQPAHYPLTRIACPWFAPCLCVRAVTAGSAGDVANLIADAFFLCEYVPLVGHSMDPTSLHG